MLIINADDFGRNPCATDRIISCFKEDRVTSASAMVFMPDSQRAAESAIAFGMNVGLHLNFTQRIVEGVGQPLFNRYQNQIAKYLTLNKYCFLFFNPALRNQFCYVYQTQFDEFVRLYGGPPSHLDGHHHMHLCANVIYGQIIPKGYRIRRNFSFFHGEKYFLNRWYRASVDKRLAKRYIMTDYLFSLSEQLANSRLNLVLELAMFKDVELQTHPELDTEFEWLMGPVCGRSFLGIPKGNFSQIKPESFQNVRRPSSG